MTDTHNGNGKINLSVEERIQTLLKTKQRELDQLLAGANDLKRQIKEYEFVLGASESGAAENIGNIHRKGARMSEQEKTAIVDFFKQHSKTPSTDAANLLSQQLGLDAKTVTYYIGKLIKTGALKIKGRTGTGGPTSPRLIGVA